MAWVYLIVAVGAASPCGATTMQLSEGFTKLGYSPLTLGVMAASVLLLAQAMKSLPMGTAYAVWTGIGALGAVIVGIVFFKSRPAPGGSFSPPCCWWASWG